MAKLEKYPLFDCVEYDYGHLSRRDYNGPIYTILRFVDNVDLHVYFYFKDFLDFHKRKKSPLHKAVERLLAEIPGWGSRHFELIERLQAEEGLDMFKLFAEFIEHIEEDLAEQYDERRHRIEENRRKNILALQERQRKEAEKIKAPPVVQTESADVTGEEDDEDEDDATSPYNRDREQLQKLVEQSSNDMYEALKINFFPQMAYFQRRYPSRCKDLTTTIEEVLHLFEEQLLNGILPKLNDEEFEEFDIQYNSQKADMSHEDEPPTAR